MLPDRPESLETPQSRAAAETILLCGVTLDGYHEGSVALAAWRTPNGPMCNYHCRQCWPEMFPDRARHREEDRKAVEDDVALAIAAYKEAYHRHRDAAQVFFAAQADLTRASIVLGEAAAELENATTSLHKALDGPS